MTFNSGDASKGLGGPLYKYLKVDGQSKVMVNNFNQNVSTHVPRFVGISTYRTVTQNSFSLPCIQDAGSETVSSGMLTAGNEGINHVTFIVKLCGSER
jgi:hypothetical protein